MHSTENGTESGGEQRTTTTSVATSGSVSLSANTATLNGGGVRECAGCRKRITERFLLKALDLFWHEDCLKCGCCDCRLGEVGSTLYTKADLILCKRDYLRLFGTTGYCAACNKVIPAFEMVMRAKSNVYHLECFACQQCNHRFCVGDRFYLCDNKILCEYDYEERLVFANMAYNPSSLAHIRRQVNNLQSAIGDVTLAQLQCGGGGGTTPLHPAHVHTHGLHPHALTAPSASCCSEKSSSSSAPESVGRHHRHQHLGPQPPPSSQRDDGSSGYGSPDSETLDLPTATQ